jgi:hypothetical protein
VEVLVERLETRIPRAERLIDGFLDRCWTEVGGRGRTPHNQCQADADAQRGILAKQASRIDTGPLPIAAQGYPVFVQA